MSFVSYAPANLKRSAPLWDGNDYPPRLVHEIDRGGVIRETYVEGMRPMAPQFKKNEEIFYKVKAKILSVTHGGYGEEPSYLLQYNCGGNAQTAETTADRIFKL